MNAPPSYPPLLFRYKLYASIKPLILTLIFGVAFVVGTVGIIVTVLQGQTPSAWVYLGMLIDAGVCTTSIYFFLNRWGGHIEIKDGQIRMIRRNDSVWMSAYLTNIKTLKYTMPKGEPSPNMFFLNFEKGGIFFSPDIENLELLLATIEQRTGKKFEKT